MDIERFAGSWKKTNEKPQWIESVDVETRGDILYVSIFGSAAPSPPVWGRVRAGVIYATRSDTTDTRGGGFLANYSFDDFDVEVQANLNLGLLVVATFVKFRGESGQAGLPVLQDRFTREFFFRGEA